MPIYAYKAVNTKKEEQNGEIIATNEKEALKTLANQGLIPIEVHLKKSLRPRKTLHWSTTISFRISDLEKSRIFRDLLLFVNAGIGLDRAFDIMGKGEKNPLLKRLFNEVKIKIEKGETFSSALRNYPKAFSPITINLIKNGELSGNLGTVLSKISDNYRSNYLLKKKILAASIYPAILLSTATIVVVGLLIFVMPKLLNSFAQSGLKLPIYTRLLIDIAAFFADYSVAIVVGLGIITLGLIIGARTKKGKMILEKMILASPIFGKIFRQLALTRFCQTLGMLRTSGLSLTESLGMAAEATGSQLYSRILTKSQKTVSKGVALSTVLEKYPRFFPYLLVGTIAVGEETGNLTKMLEITGASYQDNVNSSLNSLVSLLQPILLIIMGLIIVFIALAVLLPIYQTIGSI